MDTSSTFSVLPSPPTTYCTQCDEPDTDLRDISMGTRPWILLAVGATFVGVFFATQCWTKESTSSAYTQPATARAISSMVAHRGTTPIPFDGTLAQVVHTMSDVSSRPEETPSRLEWPNSMFQGHNRFLPSALGAAVAVLLGLFISGTRRKFRAQAVPLPPAPMDVVAPVFDTPKRLAMIATAGEKTDAAVESSRPAAAPGSVNWSWQQTMLRVKDPVKSLAFYRDLLGFTLLDRLDFPDMKFSLYFLTSLPPDAEPYALEPGTPEAHRYLWTYPGVTLELTHNWGTEDDEDFAYHPGNADRDGFGHIAVACDDVYACSAELEAAGVAFKKRPDEGRMKGLAFALDPDGYWVEIVRRGEASALPNKYNFAQTMLRVRDPKVSVPFYESLGLTLVRQMTFADFSLYFMANVPPDVVAPPPDSDEATAFCASLFGPVLELTHNHGTETEEGFAHHTGNTEGRKGFGHIGFLVDDVDAACAQLEPLGLGFVKRPLDGSMKGLAFAKDPDGYWVEIVKRGGYDDVATPYWLEPASA
uniref:Lactoylglutathione lyase n=1 Tax=Eutreptiella gymnastica TaxID=73025 RepID=A0A7S4GIX5_9EUGL|mmetsp:Transcript_49908/g.82180  ORF Transcript_49908/g.82180 Transcript_49908/m.82180 type:complete len:532 (+) Transcript_49908:24-1619(+)